MLKTTIASIGATIAGLLLVTTSSQAAPAAEMKVIGHVRGADGGWDFASFDPGRGRVYVARTDGVMTIDARTGSAQPHFADGARVHDAFALPGGREVLTTNGGDNTARILDAGSGALLASIPTGAGPDAAVVDPATGLLFVMDHGGGDITPIDLKTRKALPAIPVGGDLEVAVVDGKGRLYVNIEDKAEIAVVETHRRTVIARYPLKDCEGPTGLALLPGGRLLSSCDKVGMVVDAASGRTLARLKIGGGPDSVIYDPVRNRAYIPCGEDGTLAVIDARAGLAATALASIRTAPGARTGAVDSATGRIYLPTAKAGPPDRPGGRPTRLPGTFEVLVLGQAKAR